MNVQVPGDVDLYVKFKELTKDAFFANDQHAWKNGVEYGFTLANEQLAAFTPDYYNETVRNAYDSIPPPPTKRPFLSDTEIDDEANRVYGPAYVFPYTVGARWVRDKYEAAFGGGVTAVEPKWQPVVGQRYVFWEEYSHATVAAELAEIDNGPSTRWPFKMSNGDWYTFCAALDSFDEIGKSPGYFKARGRWSGE